MPKLISAIFVMFLATNCALLKGTTHDHMAKKLITYEYERPPLAMKRKIQKALEKQNTWTESKGIWLTQNQAHHVIERRDQAKTALAEGFTYNKKLYRAKSFSIDVADFFIPNTSDHLKNKLKNSIRTGDIHLIKDTEDELIFVKGATVITARTIGDMKTKIKACTLSSYERGPLELGFSLENYLASGFNLLSGLRLSNGPVLLEQSLKYCTRDRAMELVMLYELEPETAQSWETEIKSTM